jgi:hypothetical protein
MRDEFFISEDDWGMIELVPRENYAERQKLVDKAAAHGDAHRAPGGIGWTRMMVAPSVRTTIEARGIALPALAELIGPDYYRCARLTSGRWGTQDGDPMTGFAYRPIADDRPWNVLYGSCRDELVTCLCVTHCELPIMPVLHRLGTTFELILCDLSQDVVVDLADVVALARYMPIDD